MSNLLLAATAALSTMTGCEYRCRNGTGELSGPCPVCERDDPKGHHLYLKEGQERELVVYCQRGCSFDAIVRAAPAAFPPVAPRGADRRPTFERRSPSPNPAPRSPILYHDYRDAEGKLVLQVVRKGRGEGKEIKQRRPDGRGGWLYSLDGVAAPLYRLPELKQLAAGAVVYLCEGETDADRLAALGLAATTSVRGTGGWKEDYWHDLFRFRVVIVPDHDAPGVKLAERRLADLRAHRVESAILWLDAPIEADHGSDISDWLAMHERGELTQRSEAALAGRGAPKPKRVAAPLFYAVFTETELLEREPPMWQVEDWIEAGELTMVYGLSTAGKTFLVLDLALSIAAGRTWKGKVVVPGRVLYINADGGRGFAKRIAAWRKINGGDGRERFRIIEQPVNLYDPGQARALVQQIEGEEERWDLIVFDTLAQCMAGGSPNDPRDMYLIGALLNELRLKGHCGLLVIHHATKDGSSMLGTQALANSAASVFQVAGGSNLLTVKCEKQRNWQRNEPATFALQAVDDSAVVVFLHERAVPTPKELSKQELLTLVKETPGQTQAQLMKTTGLTRSTLNRYVTELLTAELVALAEIALVDDAEGRPPRGVFPTERAWFGEEGSA